MYVVWAPLISIVMLLVFLYFLILSLGQGSFVFRSHEPRVVSRVRDLFAFVGKFANEEGPVVPFETSNRIVESAVRLAHNEELELSHYLELLRIVSTAAVSKSALDVLTWRAVQEVYLDEQTRLDSPPVARTRLRSSASDIRTTPEPIMGDSHSLSTLSSDSPFVDIDSSDQDAPVSFLSVITICIAVAVLMRL